MQARYHLAIVKFVVSGPGHEMSSTRLFFVRGRITVTLDRIHCFGFAKHHRALDRSNQTGKRLERPFLFGAYRFYEPGYLTGFCLTSPINADNETFHQVWSLSKVVVVVLVVVVGVFFVWKEVMRR
jgi:hypothetical protein